LPAGDFIEVFVDASLETCEARDPKGLYKKARAGEIANFTGISSPYEAPEKPELVLDSNTLAPPKLAQQVIDRLVELGKIS
jgi:adenylylsulfate kinase-like enzyme